MKISLSQTTHVILTEIRRKPGNTLLIALNALPAAEMGFRAVRNSYQLARCNKDPGASYQLGGNLAGVILLTPCALDWFAGARLCGAVGFIFYSFFKGNQEKALLTSRCVHFIYSYVVSPVFYKLWKVTMFFLKAIYQMIPIFILLTAGYWIYGGALQKTDALFYREMVSNTRDMFSTVWKKL